MKIISALLIFTVVFSPLQVQATSPDEHPIKEMPRHLGQDLKESVWNPWQGFLIISGVLATSALHENDGKIQRRFQPNRPLRKIDKAVTYGAHPLVVDGAVLLAYGFAELTHHRFISKKTSVTLEAMLESLFLSETVAVGLKYAVGRDRPDGSNYSFPSMHATSAFAVASVAAVNHGPWVGIPSFALASLVGVSRIDANKHFASDVMAGALLGTVIGIGSAKFHKKEYSRYFITPTVMENGAGLSLAAAF